MRVLQSLGLKAGMPTPFYYKRDLRGVHIVPILGRDKQKATTIPTESWSKLLAEIARDKRRTFTVAPTDNPAASSDSTYKKIKTLLEGEPIEGPITTSLLAYISSILVHEGTLQLYHGRIGRDREARVVLRKSK